MIRIHHIRDGLLPPTRVDDDLILSVRRAFAVGRYAAVAELARGDLEDAYRLTQNGVVTESWTLRPPRGLTPLLGPVKADDGRLLGRRSTSIGDLMEEMDGGFHVVAWFGFRLVPGLPGVPLEQMSGTEALRLAGFVSRRNATSATTQRRDILPIGSHQVVTTLTAHEAHAFARAEIEKAIDR